MKRLKTIIIEDEPIIANGIKDYCDKLPLLEVTNVFHNGIEGLDFALKNSVDLCLVDIHMPGITGLEFISAISHLPIKIIIITSYPDYAVKGFELNVVDYLLKPFSFQRFEQSTQRAFDAIKLLSPAFISIKGNYGLERIEVEKILYVEAMHNYMILHLESKKIITYSSMQKLEEGLIVEGFIRCHKSYLVNIRKVTRLHGNFIYVNDLQIPIGRTFKKGVDKALGR
jgi:DNA-binding LytR/AlgR family response regulator